MKKRLILGGALGNCVHIGGLHHFLKIAEPEGYKTISLGPAVSVSKFVNAIQRLKPDVTAVSYRLTPEVGAELFEEFKKALNDSGLKNIKMIFVSNKLKDLSVKNIKFICITKYINLKINFDFKKIVLNKTLYLV